MYNLDQAFGQGLLMNLGDRDYRVDMIDSVKKHNQRFFLYVVKKSAVIFVGPYFNHVELMT